MERMVLMVHECGRCGPRVIHRILTRQGVSPPSLATISHILRRHELSHRSTIATTGGDQITNAQAPCPTASLSDEKWILGILQCGVSPALLSREIGEIQSLDMLIATVANGKLRERKKAVAVLARARTISATVIARMLKINRTTVADYWKTYSAFGAAQLFAGFYRRTKKSDDELLRNTLFSVLHSPPSDQGINRTTWKMRDLKRVLAKKGLPVSLDVIRQIIRAAGYRWNVARVALTSTDPDYRQKLERIQSILSAIGPNERFFSIDEYGPFAVKTRGGRSLTPPGTVRSVPQRQRSKGALILTAALELLTNQVTHFYSNKKNTAEMLRMLEVLLTQSSGFDKIYFSWDAASWHASKALIRRVHENNSRQCTPPDRRPLVELVPLPSCAQFLNVIESVFSGMAKAIIHNSDYASLDACKSALDRYFVERNAFFKANPKRAGKMIWGQERVPSQFSPSNNCKNPKYHFLSYSPRPCDHR